MPKIAYFINQYPKVSHSFIRREIQALEQQGLPVQRIALRGWDADVVDGDDLSERERTLYILQNGLRPLLGAMWKVFTAQPKRFLKTMVEAVKMGIRADRAIPHHLIYVAEACQMLIWLQERNIDHVHAHFGTNSAEVVMWVKLLGGPGYSFTVHGPEEFDKTTFIRLKEKVRHAAFVAAISSYTRSQLYRWADYADWSKIHVVHCGLENAFHAVEPQPVPAIPRFVCVGRLCEQKGQLLLVAAAQRLAQSGRDFELILAGDGEMRPEIERMIAAGDLRDKVRITGWISSDQVRDELLQSRALVLPSFAEGLPVVIMEAMALRRPVLSTYVAGIPELVRDGVDGRLFAAGDIAAIVEALDEFINLPSSTLDAMGEAARQRVLERHSVDVEAAKLFQLFREAVGHRDVMLGAEANVQVPA